MFSLTVRSQIPTKTCFSVLTGPKIDKFPSPLKVLKWQKMVTKNMFLVTNFKAVSVCTFKYHKFGFAKILNDT